jgi:hypothetical protein
MHPIQVHTSQHGMAGNGVGIDIEFPLAAAAVKGLRLYLPVNRECYFSLVYITCCKKLKVCKTALKLYEKWQ